MNCNIKPKKLQYCSSQAKKKYKLYDQCYHVAFHLANDTLA